MPKILRQGNLPQNDARILHEIDPKTGPTRKATNLRKQLQRYSRNGVYWCKSTHCPHFN